MKASDILSYSFSAIKLRKLRAGLTTLGVVIGIAAIVALLSITQGLQETITLQLQRGFATDTLIVSAGGGTVFGGEGGAGSGFKLFVNDTQTINGLENVELSVAIIQRTGTVQFAAGARNVTIIGVEFADYTSIYTTTFVAEEGGDIPHNPTNDMVVVGKRVSDPWKNGTILCNVNDTAQIIWLNSARPPKYENYTGNVTAVLQEIGGFGIGGPSDLNVYIPLSQAQNFFGTNECELIIVKLTNDDKATIDGVSKAIKEVFGDQVSVTSAIAALNTLSSVFSVIELFLGGIAAISLLVAGIGIMNIMIVSLMERTREIGILKALGMKSRTVLLIFLGESLMIGLLGAVIGVASGWGLANVVAIALGGGGGFGLRNQASQPGGFGAMAINPVLTPTVYLGAIALGLIVSVVFALYPAWRASKLKPVEALRYE